MSDRLPAEAIFDTLPFYKRCELDSLLLTSRKYKRIVSAQNSELALRDVTLWMDSPMHGFRIWETGQCRRTRNCRIYQFLRMLKGCYVRKLTIADGLHPWHGCAFSVEAFNWLAAVLRRYSCYFEVNV